MSTPRRDIVLEQTPQQNLSPLPGHRPFALLLLVYLLARAATAWYVDSYVLGGQDHNAINTPRLALAHDLPDVDDVEAGTSRDTMAYSSLYFLTALALDASGISPHLLLVAHHVAAPAVLMTAVYLSAWVLFGSTAVALIAALLLSFVNYAVFLTNVGYPILFTQLIYYGDINQVAAAVLLAAAVGRRFRVAAAASVVLSLLNGSYGLSGFLFLGTLLLAARASGRREPGLGSAAVTAGIGVALGYGLAILMLWLAPADGSAPAAARDAAIRTYGHVAIHASAPLVYIAAVGTLLLVLASAVVFERRRMIHSAGAPYPWFALVARVMLFLSVGHGVIVYWALFIWWPVGLIGASPAKFLMLGALFACPYLARFVVQAVSARPPWGMAITCAAMAALAAFHSAAGVWVLSALLALGVVVARPATTLTRSQASPSVWLLAAILVVDLGWALTRPFASGDIALASELKSVSELIHDRVPPDAVMVPFRIGTPSETPLGPFRNLALRTFSRRAYLPYWIVGRNAYFNSEKRHLAEERAFSAAGLPVWPDITATLATERASRPLEYYTGIRLQLRPCCRLALGPTTPARVLGENWDRLAQFVSTATPLEFAAYARRLGGTHVFVSKRPSDVAPWGPAIVESEHFLVLPIPPDIP